MRLLLLLIFTIQGCSVAHIAIVGNEPVACELKAETVKWSDTVEGAVSQLKRFADAKEGDTLFLPNGYKNNLVMCTPKCEKAHNILGQVYSCG